MTRTNGQFRGKCFHLMTSSWYPTIYLRLLGCTLMHTFSLTLQEIYLRVPPLAYINPNAFWGLVTLETLRITGTKLRKMPPLSSLSCSLEHLDFGNNLISNSGFILTEKFCKLKYLSLSCNRLTFVPNLRHVALSLTYLNLSFNCLESLYKLYQVQFIKLRELVLYKTCLKHISLVNLSMSMLLRLDISRNWITIMEPIDNLNLDIELWNTSDHRLSLLLDGNPWHCNDSLAWLYEDLRPPDYPMGMYMYAHIYYRDTSLKIAIISQEFVTCQTPDQFKGNNILIMCEHTCLIHKFERWFEAFKHIHFRENRINFITQMWCLFTETYTLIIIYILEEITLILHEINFVFKFIDLRKHMHYNKA